MFADAARRWTYRVVWRDDDFGELRFLAVVNTASEPDALGFNDWIPLDAASWTASADRDSDAGEPADGDKVMQTMMPDVPCPL